VSVSPFHFHHPADISFFAKVLDRIGRGTIGAIGADEWRKWRSYGAIGATHRQ
jgi:hypothetical protein